MCTDRDFGVVLNGQVEVDEDMVGNTGMLSVMNLHRALDKTCFAKFGKNLMYQLGTLFGFILKSTVILTAQIMAAQFDCFQFRRTG